MIVSELLDALLEAFPAQDAETWDHVGLSAGDQNQEVSGVLCALDATEAALEQAEALGANVLLTHHPVYLKAPDAFGPSRSDLPACSSVVYRAIRNGISIISMHTNLDRSFAARECLPALVGLSAVRSLESADPSYHGLGALCPCDDMSLKDLAQACARAFGGAPRVWGDPSRRVSAAAFLGGSLGDFGELVRKVGADAIICGEVGYHRAQDLHERGCAVIELGHDRSEQPFVQILAQAARHAGVPERVIHSYSGAPNWWTATLGESEWE